MTLRPSARPTTPCVYGVVGFGASTYRGTELPSGLHVLEQQAPALYAMDPPRPGLISGPLWLPTSAGLADENTVVCPHGVAASSEKIGKAPVEFPPEYRVDIGT